MKMKMKNQILMKKTLKKKSNIAWNKFAKQLIRVEGLVIRFSYREPKGQLIIYKYRKEGRELLV